MLALAALPTAAAAGVLSFREGVANYDGTQDLHLTIPENFTGNGHSQGQNLTDPDGPQWVWDFEATWGEGVVILNSGSNRFGMGDNVALLRFDRIFGDQPNQIPPGATITSATLQLFPDNYYALFRKPGDAANLHDVTTNWDESTRWEDFGPSPGPDMGVDFSHPIVANTGPTGAPLTIDVTASLAGWSQNPSSNRGWLFMPSGTQDILSVSGSAISNVTHVSVDLEIDTPQRGEVVVTLRHGDYTSLLVNRIHALCSAQFGTISDDIDVTLDDDATTDIHDSPDGPQPLTGSWKPDGACFSRPLCTGGGTGGLCGQPADGEWILSVTDEWNGAGSSVVLSSWAITLSDGVNPAENYASSPGSVVPKRHAGSAFSSAIWSSESPTEVLRPLLTVTFDDAPVFSPSVLEAHPQAGLRDVAVRIPAGTNATSDVTVTISSDTPSVASAPGSPLVFPLGGATSLPLQLSIGQAGSAVLTANNDAGLAVTTLPVSVGIFPITAQPGTLSRMQGSSDELVRIRIPLGANVSAPVNLTLASSDANIVNPQGGVSGSLPLVFATGAANWQDVTVQFGSLAASATLTASDDASTLGSAVIPVVLGVESPVEFDVGIEPYIQLGNAPLGAATDQFVVAWQTILREAGGANADRFTVEYRRVGDPSWIPAALNAPVPASSTSRVNQSATLSPLDFDEQYEYRVTHLRNEVAIATHQHVVNTRGTGPFRFTAFGNTGQASDQQEQMAQVALSFDPDVHLLLGDNVYYHGEPEHFKPRVGDVYQTLMRTRAVHFTLGNHDRVTEEGRPNLDFFFEPENGPPALVSELNYSFDYGDVHFVSVDSGSSLGNGPIPTYVAPWLAADLAASTKPWKVVFTHEPPVTRDPYGVDREEQAIVRDELLKVAVDAGAQLFLSGATHSMQRYLPITDVIATPPYIRWASCSNGNGTTLVYAGTGAWFRTPPGPIPSVLDAPMEVYAPQLGVLVVDVSAGQMTVNLMDDDGLAIDTVTIDQCLSEQDCQCASQMTLYGIAVGGHTVSLTLAGVPISLVTQPLQPAKFILEALADLINSDPTLISLGFNATALDNTLSSNATIKNIVIDDPRLAEDLGDLHLPGLSPIGLAILTAALIAGTFVAARRSRNENGH